jgi:alkylation response protein AidB-like acyl-CoA dehydrogenase
MAVTFSNPPGVHAPAPSYHHAALVKLPSRRLVISGQIGVRPDDRSFLFPRTQARITDDWQVLGLRGTGSDTYAVEDLFIPDDHAPARDAPEERRETGPLYGFHTGVLYASGFAGVALGVSRRLLDALIGLARGKQGRAAINPMAQNHAIQKEVALLEAQWRAARALLHQAITDAWALAEAGQLSLDARMALRLATTYAMNQATEGSITSYRMAGTTAILDAAPFERRFRDAMAVSQHLQGMSAHLEMVGRHLIGTENVVQWA